MKLDKEDLATLMVVVFLFTFFGLLSLVFAIGIFFGSGWGFLTGFIVMASLAAVTLYFIFRERKELE